MFGKWKDSIARCTRLNRLKRSTFFIYLSFINGDSDSAHENTSQEIIPRNKIRFFRTICKISKRWKYRNRSKGLLFLNFPLKFGKSTEEKRKHDVKDVPKYVLGESNRGGEEEW